MGIIRSASYDRAFYMYVCMYVYIENEGERIRERKAA